METILTTEVLKEQVVDVKSQSFIDGKEVTVITPTKLVVPVKLGIQKPGRRLTESAEIFYAKTIAHYIKEGLLSVHMLSKRYDNDGGPFNDLEHKVMERLSSDKQDLTVKYWELLQKETKTDEEKKTEGELLEKISDLQQRIDRIQNPYIAVYNQTAEYKARNKAVSWWLIHLALIEKDGKLERLFSGREVFKDEELELQFDKLMEQASGEDEVMREITRKLTYLVSCWSNGAQFVPIDKKPESIEAAKRVQEAAEKAYNAEFPDYPHRHKIDTQPVKVESKE